MYATISKTAKYGKDMQIIAKANRAVIN